jgi:hypothetical protein
MLLCDSVKTASDLARIRNERERSRREGASETRGIDPPPVRRTPVGAVAGRNTAQKRDVTVSLGLSILR